MTKFAILAAVLVSISIVVESAPTPDYTRRFCGTNDAQYEGHPICGAFYQCVHGVMVPRLCAKGTIWNDEFNYCDHPYKLPHRKCQDVPDQAALTHYIRVEQGRSGFRTYEAPEEVVEEIIPEGGEVIEEVNFIEEPVFNPRAAEGGSVVEALTANNHRQYQG